MNQLNKVLVVDDSPFVFKAVKKALEPEGFQMLEQAFNGKEGLEKAAQSKPDVIILDITMPVMDGLETAQNLLEQNPQMKIIMLSAMGDEEIIKTARNLGIKDFLTKPFKAEDMVTVVRSIL